ncbi:uncharacterized protein E0L32_011870 [Thyridium curvatum]|uniref:glycerophosphodiester phosphodiesterase n=1 Tax=Thyridium curvatum TaxID=1093900 RepID=A0A507BLH9_9PEZI|nr:uncharacterized protein E0L32_011870 [Thyridium curvatum]TPX18051.1 hypothetical protein E0L32_011870 [Thyridium curvatum]
MSTTSLLIAGLLAFGQQVSAAPANKTKCGGSGGIHPVKQVQLGPRPYFLVNDMDAGPLKDKLLSCSEMSMKPTEFSIGHRGGGTMLIPEETVQSQLAGARMGAGILECDVAFTADRQLVCRHDVCDLHRTTNIVTIPELNAKCTKPFEPAANGKKASAKCCTSDITLAEFKTLCSKMDGENTAATNAKDYLRGTSRASTDLYATCGKVMTHKEWIRLVDQLGLKFTPELKTAPFKMPFKGNYTQAQYAQQFVNEYREMGIDFSRVWPQSFLYDDILYWLKNEPEFAKQAVLLDESGDSAATFPKAVAALEGYRKAGVNVIAPPLPYLVKLDGNNQIVPSAYATEAKRLGFKIITWTVERSGILSDGSGGGFYYTSIANATNNDGDVYNLIDVLAQQVGVVGIFSDWSATVTYYANCFGIFPNH